MFASELCGYGRIAPLWEASGLADKVNSVLVELTRRDFSQALLVGAFRTSATPELPLHPYLTGGLKQASSLRWACASCACLSCGLTTDVSLFIVLPRTRRINC